MGLYDEHAAWYDLCYSFKDYDAETAQLRGILDQEGVPRGARTLEAACGTGGFLGPLSADYAIDGFDLSPQLLEIAAAKQPGARLWAADLRDFEVDTPYELILCLFSSIGYLIGAAETQKAFRAFHRALAPGGLLVVEPWLDPDDAISPHHSFDVARNEELSLARAAHSHSVDDVTVVRFDWLAATADGFEEMTEEHRLWLCPRDEMRALLEAAGFDVTWRADGLSSHGPSRGLFLAKRR